MHGDTDLTHHDEWLPLFEVVGWQTWSTHESTTDDFCPVVASHHITWGGEGGENLLLSRSRHACLVFWLAWSLLFQLRRYPLIVQLHRLARARCIAFGRLFTLGRALPLSIYILLLYWEAGWVLRSESFGSVGYLELFFAHTPSLGRRCRSRGTTVSLGLGGSEEDGKSCCFFFAMRAEVLLVEMIHTGWGQRLYDVELVIYGGAIYHSEI